MQHLPPMGMLRLCLLVFIASSSLAAHALESRTKLQRCLTSARISTLVSSSPDYNSTVLPWNLRVPIKPVAVATPETASQVAAAVRCANKHDVKVAARSGGHSYGSFGLGGVDGSLVIDMKHFKTLEVDPRTNIASVGPGNRLGNVAVGLFEQGKRALPHGLCPGVGIGGHATHGGFGWTSRMWGTTLDTIVSMEVVLADGSIRNSSRVENPDLFWAMRGAGDSFGIVTKLNLQTLPAPSNGVQFTFSFPSAKTTADLVAIFSAFQQFSLTQAPAELALRTYIAPGAILITGVYWGQQIEYETIIAPLRRALPSDTSELIKEGSWLATLTDIGAGTGDGDTLEQPENYTKHDTFFAKSILTPDLLSNDTLTSFIGYAAFGPTPPVGFVVIADLYGGRGSKISSISLEDASYAGRDTLFTFQLYSYLFPGAATYPEAGIAYMNAMSKSMTDTQPGTAFQAYPNYVDPTLSADEAHRLYYGSQYPRLRRIKKVVDPDMRFWNPQAIGAR